MKSVAKILHILICLSAPIFLMAQPEKIIVDAGGNGNFKTIQGAINSLSDSSAKDRIIFIRNGVYKEKILISKRHVVLQGEDREKTIITGSIANGIYTCDTASDKYSVIINIEADDITLLNFKIENTYGLNAPDSSFQLECMNKESKKSETRTIVKYTHQFALRVFSGTRLKVVGCTILSWGADTVAPWNGKTGMYYFKDCIMQGGTDFYCPRGWAYAENCTFICLKTTAASMWHDGRYGQSMKSVIKNCTFKGDDPYKLGRYHHDAHFYFINCAFDKNLADTPVFKAATAKEVYWAPREYYFNCHRESGNYDWMKNNLTTAQDSPEAEKINAAWAFDGMWQPEK